MTSKKTPNDEELELLKRILQKENSLEKEGKASKKVEEKLLQQILRKQVELEAEEKRIHDEEAKVKQILKKLYRNVNDWRVRIWNNCEFKEIEDKGKEIVYNCAKLHGLCNFDDCPLNEI